MSDKNTERMEKIVSLCKRRGFIFQAGEIYGGLNGCWDYGPLGTELKRNLKEYWWRRNVQMRDDIEGLDGAILTHQAVLTASGHVGGFSDPLCICLLTGERLRADQVPAQSGFVFAFSGAISGDGLADMEKKPGQGAGRRAQGIPRRPGRWQDGGRAGGRAGAGCRRVGRPPRLGAKRLSLPFRVLVAANAPDKALKVARQFYERRGLKNAWPVGLRHDGRGDGLEANSIRRTARQLSPPRQFNLMFQTTSGPRPTRTIRTPSPTCARKPRRASSSSSRTCSTPRGRKLPFGIAQIGKAFRNEINPRNFTFRSREFEQMEIEYFCRPEDGLRLTDEWLEERLIASTRPSASRATRSTSSTCRTASARSIREDLRHRIRIPVRHPGTRRHRLPHRLRPRRAPERLAASRSSISTRKRKPEIPAARRRAVAPAATAPCWPSSARPTTRKTVTDDKGKEETRIVLRFHPRMAPVKAARLPAAEEKRGAGPEGHAKSSRSCART